MSKDIFPLPLPIVVISGEFESGKTLAILTTGYPLERTLIYDNEKSSAIYAAQAPFVRVDLMDELNKKSTKWTDIEFYLAWKEHAASIKPGQYDVIGIDTIERLESGIADYVKKNPYPGRTSNQYMAMGGVYWNDVKDLIGREILALTAKCKMVIITVHMRDVWDNKKPTNQRERKGKDTLSLLATLEIILQRKPGQIRPSAIVSKTRLTYGDLADPKGIRPMFDKFIPEFTWDKVRWYMNHGTDPDNPILPPDTSEEDERMREEHVLELKAKIAEAELAKAGWKATERCPICNVTAAPDDNKFHAHWCVMGPDGVRVKDPSKMKK
jgi:hypothetical protein